MTDYAFAAADGRVYTPNGLAPGLMRDQVDAHNQASERAALARWKEAPPFFGVYIVDNGKGELVAQTWLGAELGRVVEYKTSRCGGGWVKKSPMAYIRVSGNNGAEYFGRYGYEWSQFCRLRKGKKKTRRR